MPIELKWANCFCPSGVLLNTGQYIKALSVEQILYLTRCKGYNVLEMEVTGVWWRSWSSKPVWGLTVPGGFDSHSPPPFLFCEMRVWNYNKADAKKS